MRTTTHISIRSICYVTALCLALAACSSSNNNDKIRIGSGQVGNSITKSADFPIFYVKRGTPNFVAAAGATVADDSLKHQLICNNNKLCSTNADLYMRDRASTDADEHNITARVRAKPTDVWDVKDVDVSADGTKVIFAMRGPLTKNMKATDPPTWGIWEYVIATDDLHRIIADDVSANSGQDVSPHYLPDGHIIFSSTRQRNSKAILLDEGKPQFEAQDEDNRHESAFVLHIMNSDGTDIQQLTINQSHDLNPTVLSNGRLLFSRWDNTPNRTGGGGIHLYTSNPDGTDVELLYGAHSHNTVADTDPTAIADAVTYPDVEFVQPHEMQDGAILTLVRTDSGTEYGGDLYEIDTRDFVENSQTTASNAGMAGSGQVKIWANTVRMLTGPSPGGRFVSAAPLWDGTGRILVSWSQCRVLDPTDGVTIVPCTSDNLASATTMPAPPIYSIWMFDPVQQTLQPIVVPTEGTMMSDVVIAQPKTAPVFLPYSLSGNPNINTTYMGQGVGVLDIRSVYDFDGKVGGGITSIAAVSDPTNAAYATRPARFLRIEKAVSLPAKTVRDVNFNVAFGATGFMREILGYIPIEPDGSVMVEVPGNVAFEISVTDANGQALPTFPRHNSWLSIQPGETVKCNGCHTPTDPNTLMMGQSGISHGRSGLFAQAYAGASAVGPFPNANPAFTASNAGDTMAEARAAWSCVNERCASITPSVDLVFSDVWPGGTALYNSCISPQPSTCNISIPPAAPTRTGDFSLVYNGIVGVGGTGVPKAPTSSSCTTTAWSNLCRITIDYETVIQPMWDAPLGVDVNNDGNKDTMDTCTACHNHSDADVTTPQTLAQTLAARQLDLRGVVPDNNDNANENPDQFVSYQELLFQDTELTANATTGVLLPLQVPSGQVDANGNPILVTVPINGTRLNALSAKGSRFFNVFSNNQCQHSNGTIGACVVNHTGWLTPGELRLISEWVDIGAQYYNNPFTAPVN